MKKTKYRRLAAMAASLLCCLIFTVPAYAQSSEPQPETIPAPAETEAEPETQNPFTPDGTGTVVDNATDEDGKEFYTITTADESVFYLHRYYNFTELTVETVSRSLHHSCRSELTRQGISLP